MEIAIGCDSCAYDLKVKVIEHLNKKGLSINDYGPHNSSCAVDYPDYAFRACRAVLEGTAQLAILICGTGIGMSMSANKLKGIRCAVCGDTFSAKMTRLHNDANVLAIGSRVIGEGLALEIIDAFIDTEFSNVDRHIRRIEKITRLENGESL